MLGHWRPHRWTMCWRLGPDLVITRARNLHKAARQLVEYGDEQLLEDPLALQRLPGIGPYTAGAIAALAYGRQTVVVDGNIERLFCRFFAIDTPLPAAKKQVAAAYQDITAAAPIRCTASYDGFCECGVFT